MENVTSPVAFPTVEGVERAAQAIDPVFTGTPLVNNASLDRILGCHLVAKVESLNPIRSFKGRGASWFIQNSNDSAPRELVTASVGNFGQGLAYAARSGGRRLTIFAATTAAAVKTQAMAALGAELVLDGADFDEAKVAAAEYAARTGAVLVVDGAEPFIAEGGGTIGYELVREHGSVPLDVVLVPLGNGAQIAGIGVAVKSRWPNTKVVGVAASGAPAMALSWRAGEVIECGPSTTIADGLAVRVPIPYALDVMRECVDDVLTVTDEQIAAAMYLAYRHYGLVTEPAAVAGIAAVLADPESYAGSTVGTVLCGANVEHDVFMRMVQAGAQHV